MRGDYPDDTFTENDVLRALESVGLRYKNGGRYILSQCPTHEDANPSAQIYKDDWFVNCHTVCGRYHITKAFPELRQQTSKFRTRYTSPRTTNERPKKTMTEHKYKQFDLMKDWGTMIRFHNPTIPKIHGIPWEVLDSMGWRWADTSTSTIFIPYFSASKQSIPFAQYRHLGGNVRFTMLKDAKPTCYGTWNLDNPKLFLVEGCSDAAVMEYAGVPWIAAPSASSGGLVRRLAAYCKENGITIVFAGDNDSAGSKLREALDEIGSYRVKQPPKEYKDWGEMLEATDIKTIQNYCFPELEVTIYSESGYWGSRQKK